MEILIKNGDWAWTLGINETLNERQLFTVMKVTKLDANSQFLLSMLVLEPFLLNRGSRLLAVCSYYDVLFINVTEWK